jgi:hypothetical protein
MTVIKMDLISNVYSNSQIRDKFVPEARFSGLELEPLKWIRTIRLAISGLSFGIDLVF